MKKINRFSQSKQILLALFVLTSFLLQACGATQATPETIKLKAVVLPYTSFGPFFIAQEEGYFAEQNLEVEFVRFDSGTSPLPMLEQGEVDVLGSGPSLSLFNAIANNSEIRVVADKGYLDSDGCTYMAIMATNEWLAKNPTPDADAFRSANVSIDPTNFEAFMFEKAINETGVGLDNINTQDIAPPALAEAAQNNAIDIISIGDPWIVRLTDTDQVSIFKPYQEVVPNMQFGFVLFGPSLYKENPEAGTRFMAAYLKGIQQYNEGKTPRNLEIMSEYTQLDTATLQKACWPPMNATGNINTQTINEFQAWANEKGLIDKIVPEEQYWDPSFLNQALEIIE